MIGYCRGISRAHNWLLMHLCDAISVVTLTVSELPCHSVTARTTSLSYMQMYSIYTVFVW
jgi:hypothetical protein